MALNQQTPVEIPTGLLDAIRDFPVERRTEHCGAEIVTSPFDFYAQCPRCGAKIKLRSFSAGDEIEDVFDAVFEWMSRPLAAEAAARRKQDLEGDEEE